MTTSVVVAAFNEEEHIARLVDSLSHQTQPALEILVIDDGSTDRTAEVARDAGAEVWSVPHRGPALARNFGAQRASGDVVVFLDGDMAVSSVYLERIVVPIEERGEVGTFTKEIWIGNPVNPWSRAYASIRRQPFPRLLGEGFPDRWKNFRAVRRDAFLAVGGYDDVGYGEDMTIASKLGRIAAAAPGAACVHFNPGSAAEIFGNGRWIGRGHDIAEVAHPWLVFGPARALVLGLGEAARQGTLIALAARLIYHAGVTLGLLESRLNLATHAK
jgi:glycosyltransferase involved in cell wall biosynthesis